MTETAVSPFSIKHSPERRAVAAQLRKVRNGEREEVYEVNRSGSDYLVGFRGLRAFFQYVRELGSSNIVLDIGAGTTKAAKDLSRDAVARGLEIQATVLTHSMGVDSFLGKGKTHATSAEVLNGIPNRSIGGVLAVNSVAYSADPSRVVERIDQVLVPGGVIKAAFNSFGPGAEYNRWLADNLGYKTRDPFVRKWMELDYDVALGPDGLVLVKKPGGPSDVSALSLFKQDELRTATVKDLVLSFKRKIGIDESEKEDLNETQFSVQNS